MDVLPAIVMAGILSIFPPFLLALVVMVPFFLWQFPFGRDGNVEFADWLDKALLPTLVGTWLIGWQAHPVCRLVCQLSRTGPNGEEQRRTRPRSKPLHSNT